MRILFLSNGYPPRQTAGTENYTAGIASALVRASHQVAVVCAGDWDSGPAAFNGLQREELDGVTIIRLDLNWTQGPDPNHFLFDNPLTEQQIGQVVDQWHPDMVHITSCYTLSASIIRAVKARHLPLVVTLTDFWFFCPRVTLLRSDGNLCDGQTTPWECLRCLLGNSNSYQWPARILPEAIVAAGLTLASQTPRLSRRPGLRGMALDMAARKQTLPALLNLADAVIAPSQFLADVARTCGLLQSPHVMPYGHNLAWVKQLPRHTSANQLRVGYVGRMTPAKGAHILLGALGQLSLAGRVQAHLFGNLEQEPGYGAELVRLAADNPAIHFHGPFSRNQLPTVYSQIDVLVVPSLWYENNPLVIQEAFAAGLPVVASRLGGMSEFVTHRKNGMLFEPGDPAALAVALTELVEHPALLLHLRTGIPPVRTIAEELEAISSLYMRLIHEHAPQMDAPPQTALAS